MYFTWSAAIAVHHWHANFANFSKISALRRVNLINITIYIENTVHSTCGTSLCPCTSSHGHSMTRYAKNIILHVCFGKLYRTLKCWLHPNGSQTLAKPRCYSMPAEASKQRYTSSTNARWPSLRVDSRRSTLQTKILVLNVKIELGKLWREWVSSFLTAHQHIWREAEEERRKQAAAEHKLRMNLMREEHKLKNKERELRMRLLKCQLQCSESVNVHRAAKLVTGRYQVSLRLLSKSKVSDQHQQLAAS